jgi:hypothetical protein
VAAGIVNSRNSAAATADGVSFGAAAESDLAAPWQPATNRVVAKTDRI